MSVKRRCGDQANRISSSISISPKRLGLEAATERCRGVFPQIGDDAPRAFKNLSGEDPGAGNAARLISVLTAKYNITSSSQESVGARSTIFPLTPRFLANFDHSVFRPGSEAPNPFPRCFALWRNHSSTFFVFNL